MKKVLFIFLFLSVSFPFFSQQDSLGRINDSIAKVKAERKKTYSAPRRASIMSAILPGLGQAYNSLGQPFRKTKYWKIPIIYGGLGGFGYMFKVNNEQYRYFQKNLRAQNDDDPNTINETRWDTEDLRTQKITYRKRRDIAVVGIAVLYLLNIVDANVDAHLKTFDVSDDLSIHVDPWVDSYYNGRGLLNATGISIKLNLK